MAETVITKRCEHCKSIKPIMDFYRSNSSKDGLQYICKICYRIYSQSEKAKRSQKEYNRTENGKKNKFHCTKKYRSIHPEQRKAVTAVYRAVKSGRLPSPRKCKCFYCGHQAEQYHHHRGYEREHWLDVVPVCKNCHYKTHYPIT